MKHLTNREEEIMEQFWYRGPLFINDILKALGDLKLHYNTVSTVVRGLEDKGFVDHEQFGNTYRYFPVISREDFSRMSLQNIVGKYFNHSYASVLSMFVSGMDTAVGGASAEEIRELIAQVEAHSQKEKK